MTPEKAAELLDELHMLKLEVILTPSKRPEEAMRGGMVRTVVCHNPGWYSRLCTAHQKNRKKPRRSAKPDTRIVRRDVIRLLERVLSLKPAKSYIIDWLEGRT